MVHTRAYTREAIPTWAIHQGGYTHLGYTQRKQPKDTSVANDFEKSVKIDRFDNPGFLPLGLIFPVSASRVFTLLITSGRKAPLGGGLLASFDHG